MEAHQHPYWPPSAQIPGFVPNESSVARLLPAFGCVAGAVVASAYRLAGRRQHRLRPADRFAAAWFALCGFLHVGFEGYYVVNRAAIAGSQTLPAQLWKEYALSDSRYLTSDAFAVSIETVTALVWGPLCWLALVAIVRGWPSRHGVQVVVCTAHLYGVALYFATALATGVAHSRPEPLYRWVYFVGFNLPWAVVPLVLLRDSFVHMGRAFAALAESQARAKHR